MIIRRTARALVRRLRRLRRRGARIGELVRRALTIRAENERLRRALATADREVRAPSFYRKYEESKRHWNAMAPSGPPVRALLSKQLSYALARSHGVATPEIFGVWDDPGSIDWANLPDAFVLKTNRGSTSRGVFPCRRDGDLLLVGGSEKPVRPAELVERIAEVRGTGKIMYPLFAEEWLRTETIEPPDVPEDVKLYTFFGKVGMIMLRSVPKHGARYAVRYLSREGEDLGDISPDRTISDQIPIPEDLDGLVSAAERLSAATRSPFIRVDLYETTRGVVFGELTPLPGGRQHFAAEVDARLGAMWEDAERRLAGEIMATGVLDLVHGPHLPG